MSTPARTITIDLPPTFYDDHASRDLASGRELKRTKRYVRVELDREAYDELLSDARHYSEPDPSWTIKYDAHLLAISRSARATVKRLEAVEPPDGTITVDEVFPEDDPEVVAALDRPKDDSDGIDQLLSDRPSEGPRATFEPEPERKLSLREKLLLGDPQARDKALLARREQTQAVSLF